MVVSRRSPRSSSFSPEQQPQVVVPHLNKDPVWSLCPWPVLVDVGGVDVEIPAAPARDWLVVLLRSDFDLDFMIQDMMPDVEELLLEGVVELEEVHEICLDVIATVSARPWWVALRLLAVLKRSWEILWPALVSAGVDVHTQSLACCLDILLVTIIRSMDPKDVTLFSSRLEAPPPNVEVTPEELEMSQSDFMSMA